MNRRSPARHSNRIGVVIGSSIIFLVAAGCTTTPNRTKDPAPVVGFINAADKSANSYVTSAQWLAKPLGATLSINPTSQTLAKSVIAASAVMGNALNWWVAILSSGVRQSFRAASVPPCRRCSAHSSGSRPQGPFQPGHLATLCLVGRRGQGLVQPTPGDTAASTDHPSTDHPSTDHASTDHASTDHPSPDHPSTDHPSTDHPSTDHPSTDHPSTDHPSTDHPSTDHPSTDHPSTDHV